MIGSIGPDTITGNASDNVLDGGPGTCRDSLSGLGGRDTVSYAHAMWPVSVSLDGKDNDGARGTSQYCFYDEGENDHFASDFENVRGGPYGDTLSGDAGVNLLDGLGGDDVLRGLSGADLLSGGDGGDSADYSERITAVSVATDGTARSGNVDDGPPGGRDTVDADVERLLGGRGDDALTGSGVANVLWGDAGADTLNGQGGSDTLRGGPGADVLNGGAGIDTSDYSERTAPVEVTMSSGANDGEDGERDDVGPAGDVENVIAGTGDDLVVGDERANRLDGGPGQDLLDGGAGADALIGGPGNDVADYEMRNEPLTLAIDGAPGSGGASDNHADTIGHDVESLWGGSAADRLTGDDRDNSLSGGGGADTMAGGGGFDAADYSDRTDSVSASPDGQPTSGNAQDGQPGARDTIGLDVEDLYGGDGADLLTGSTAENLIDAGAGDDTVDVSDSSSDGVACGDGTDTAIVDPDDATDQCETVRAPLGSQPSPGAASTGVNSFAEPAQRRDTSAPRVTITLARGTKLTKALVSGLSVRVTCSEACTLRGALSVDGATAKKLGLSRRAKRVVVAKATAARAGALTLRFTPAARKRLRRAPQLTLKLVVRASDTSANLSTSTLTLRLSRTRATLGTPRALSARRPASALPRRLDKVNRADVRTADTANSLARAFVHPASP